MICFPCFDCFVVVVVVGGGGGGGGGGGVCVCYFEEDGQI